MQHKPWRNEELRECEEALPRLKEGDLDMASRLYRGKNRFHPKVPLDLTEETRGEIVEFLEKVEQSGKWPHQACTTMFFLIPKNVTSEKPIALFPTLIRWWEALRAPEVVKWQQKYRVDWDATDGRNGGAQRTVWEEINGNGEIRWKSKSRGSRRCGFGAGPCEGIRASQPSCGLGLGDAFLLPKKDLAGAVRSFRAPGASAVRRMCGGAAPDHHGHLARVQVELFAFAYCSCDERSHKKIFPSLKLGLFVDAITTLVKGRNKDVAEMAKKKVMKKLKEEVETKGLKLSVTEKGKEGKNKMIASCGFLEKELSQFSQEGVTLADGVETLGVDLRTRVKRLGAKENARRKNATWSSRSSRRIRLSRRTTRKWVSRTCYVQA